jgi:hypothetical protein
MHGVSGGSMLDEKGRVWGVNSVSEPYTSTIKVIPLSAGHDGQPRVNIQKVFVSDDCYNPFEYQPHRCQVMPNMYREKDVP